MEIYTHSIRHYENIYAMFRNLRYLLETAYPTNWLAACFFLRQNVRTTHPASWNHP
jgi:hypothetical protein